MFEKKYTTMKLTKLTIALLSAAAVFTSCNDDDDLGEGRFDRAELYATSTANGNITVYDFSDRNNVETSTLTTVSTSNEGISYDASSNELTVASRSNGTLNTFTNIEEAVDGTTTAVTGAISSTDLTSPRAIAVSGNLVVVSDNDGDMGGPDGNEFYVYTKSGSTLTLRDRFEIPFAVWGIEFIGNDLFAVVDQTADLAVFENFAANQEDPADATDNVLTATKRITIANLGRTHGITYNADDNLLIMTDIDQASSDSDGGFNMIPNFTTEFANVANGGTLAASSQTIVKGSATFLGNPIDVKYDDETKTVFIAEIANGGGRVLGFSNIGNGGNIAPQVNNMLEGASSVEFYEED